MKLYRCMHHIETICHEQGRQLLHFWSLFYLPLTKFHIVNRVRAITPKQKKKKIVFIFFCGVGVGGGLLFGILPLFGTLT